MKTALLAAWLFCSAAFGVEVFSTWVHPLRKEPRFDLLPYERTRPIVLGDIVFSADQQGRVVAIHRTQGYVLWETKMPGGVSGAFAYGRSKLIVGDRQGNLIALNSRDGSESWRFKTQGEWLSPPVIPKGRNLVIAITSTGDLFGIKMDSEHQGEELWHYARRGSDKMTVWGSGGPVLFGDTEVYQGFADGTLVALSAEKGRVLWERTLASRERFKDIDMVPFVDDKRVLAATYDGQVFSVDRVSGDTQWVFPVGAYGGFTVEGNRVFFAGVNHQFYAIDLTTGQPIWTTAYEGGIGSAPLMVRGNLIFPTSSDPLYVVDPRKGKILGKVTLGAGALATPAGGGEDGMFYTLSNYGNLYAFHLRLSDPPRFPAGF
jgi:outer membrane protein assembly factor BamB